MHTGFMTTGPAFHSSAQHSWDSGRVRWQQITNSVVIPEKRHQRRWTAPVRVRMRLRWERDGEEWAETTATHWARVDGETLVLVEITDPRRRTKGAWLRVEDVEQV